MTAEPVLVPQSVIRLLDKQIEGQRRIAAEAEARLKALIEARARVAPMHSPSGEGKARGGHARAEALPPARRKEIAQKAAKRRWSKE